MRTKPRERPERLASCATWFRMPYRADSRQY
jgi:hypothetical protein